MKKKKGFIQIENDKGETVKGNRRSLLWHARSDRIFFRFVADAVSEDNRMTARKSLSFVRI